MPVMSNLQQIKVWLVMLFLTYEDIHVRQSHAGQEHLESHHTMSTGSFWYEWMHASNCSSFGSEWFWGTKNHFFLKIVWPNEFDKNLAQSFKQACMLRFWNIKGHRGIFALINGTLWGNCKFLLEHFKGTKSMSMGHGANHLRCLHEVSGLSLIS